MAFDSIAPEGLLWALARFGVNETMLEAIQEIYSSRSFVVQDEGHESGKRPQRAGISQGCPLSPFLFGMLMIVLMADASGSLSDDAKNAFADDTLLISKTGKHLGEYMSAVEKSGMDYGLHDGSSQETRRRCHTRRAFHGVFGCYSARGRQFRLRNQPNTWRF